MAIILHPAEDESVKVRTRLSSSSGGVFTVDSGRQYVVTSAHVVLSKAGHRGVEFEGATYYIVETHEGWMLARLAVSTNNGRCNDAVPTDLLHTAFIGTDDAAILEVIPPEEHPWLYRSAAAERAPSTEPLNALPRSYDLEDVRQALASSEAVAYDAFELHAYTDGNHQYIEGDFLQMADVLLYVDENSVGKYGHGASGSVIERKEDKLPIAISMAINNNTGRGYAMPIDPVLAKMQEVEQERLEGKTNIIPYGGVVCDYGDGRWQFNTLLLEALDVDSDAVKPAPTFGSAPQRTGPPEPDR